MLLCIILLFYTVQVLNYFGKVIQTKKNVKINTHDYTYFEIITKYNIIIMLQYPPIGTTSISSIIRVWRN